MPDATPPDSARTGGPLALVYFLGYASLGVIQPYLPQHLHALGMSGATAGKLLACFPLMTFLAPPVWGWVADRSRRAAMLLVVALFACAAAYVPLLFASTPLAILPWLATAAFFYAPVGMLLDSLNLERVQHRGGHFAQTRLWGSLGFIAATSAFSLVYDGSRMSPPPVIVAIGVLCAVAGAASLLVAHNRAAPRAPARLSDAIALLKDARIRVLVGAAFLHWIACAPFNSRFTVHLNALGLPSWVAGLGIAAGVVAEVAVMAFYPSLAARFTPARVLAVSIAASAVRWILVGLSTSAAPLVLLQLLHGLTFGAFLVSAIAYLTAIVPPRLRATGQALFASVAFGLSGVIGLLAAGHLFDLRPASDVFVMAGLFELLPAWLALRLPAPPTTGEDLDLSVFGGEV